MKLSIVLSLAVLASAGPVKLAADSIPYPYAGNIPNTTEFRAAGDGDVMAYFYGSTAMFSEQLGLFVNGVQQGGWVLDDHASAFGDAVNFGAVHAGDHLMFAINVQDVHYTLFSDPALNPDGINHVYSTSFSGETRGDASIPSGMFASFEDSLLSFSDLNYNDEDFVFGNVYADTAPEPASVLLCVAGFSCIGLGLTRRRKRALAKDLD